MRTEKLVKNLPAPAIGYAKAVRAGFPVALNGLFAVKEVFQRRDIAAKDGITK